MDRSINSRALPFLLVALMWPGNLFGQDWSAIRGTDGNGSAMPGGILSASGPVALEVRWKKSFGSGYSSVVVAGDHVVSMCVDGDHDHVICLDKNSGATIWKTATGPEYKGENGSFDGPISTPLIYDGHVVALDPNGMLFCLKLDDGQEVWSTDLVNDQDAVKPLYGFATSPIVAGETLVVQTGAKNKSLTGFDLETGAAKWAVSNDTIDSQTPAVVNFDGTDIVLAAGGEKLTGVDPANGNILFEYEHEGGNGSAMVPVPTDDHHVILTLDDSFSKSISLRPGVAGEIEVADAWQDRSIKNTYNVPALFDGNLFAYSTRILTCVDAASGKAIWKSRKPGDGFLISIDGHLIINTKQGGLHVARATREGYQEVAQLDLFADLVWSIPAYSDNAIFVRSLSEIARVDIVAGEKLDEESGQATMPMGREFARLIDFLDKHPQPQERSAAIDNYLDEQSSFPIVEGDVVHFVYRGPGQDVALASDIFGARQEKTMVRVEGTDFFYYTLQLENDPRANYVFLVDYQPQTDPRNTRTVTSSMYAGEMEFAVRLRNEKPLEMSWFGMSSWREPDYLKSFPETLRGSIKEQTVESEQIEDELKFEIYTPPGYEADGQQRYRTVYVFGGRTVRQIGKLAAAADNLFAAADRKALSAILVFVQVQPTPQAVDAIAEDLVPYVDGHYLTKADRRHRALAGFGFAAGGALDTLGSHANLFSAIALQSPMLFDAAQAGAFAALQEIDQPVEVYIDWGRFDMYNPHENWDVRTISERVFDHCKTNKHLQVSGGMVNDSADWASWRNRYHNVLTLGVDEAD
jgi:outer membrane protein assembly factor BamB